MIRSKLRNNFNKSHKSVNWQYYKMQRRNKFLKAPKRAKNSCLKKAVVQRCSVKKMYVEISQNSQKNTCARVWAEAYNFIKKEALTQVFSCEFCGTSKNTFLYKTLLMAASVFRNSGQPSKLSLPIKVKPQALSFSIRVME